MAYTPLASKAVAWAGLRMVVPVMGESKPVLAALLNGNGRKTGPLAPGAPVCRCPATGASPEKVTVKRSSRVALSKVPAKAPVAVVGTAGTSWAPLNAPVTAGRAAGIGIGSLFSFLEQAVATKRLVANKRVEKMRFTTLLIR